MFGKNEPIGIRFITTTGENLSDDLRNQGNGIDNFALGLSNSDLFINAVEVQSGIEDEEKEELVIKQLSKVISNYDSMDYINREIPIKSYTFEETEKTLILSISRAKIEEIIDVARARKVFLIGIYPSFLLDDQENLSDLISKFDFIPAEEIEEDEVDINGERKARLVFLNQGEPFDLKEQIFEELDAPDYNFLGPEYKAKFKRPLLDEKITIVIKIVVALAIIGYIALSFLINKSIKNIELENLETKKIEKEIKELESKINLIPNWEAKLRKLEQILAANNTATNEIMYGLKKAAPQGLYIEKMEIRMKFVMMTGTTNDIDKIFQFERALSDAGFINIKHTTITNNSNGGFSFSIESGLK